MGAMSTPAKAASAAPSAQLIAAIVSGECPVTDAASWFSATAEVTRPKELKR